MRLLDVHGRVGLGACALVPLQGAAAGQRWFVAACFLHLCVCGLHCICYHLLCVSLQFGGETCKQLKAHGHR